MAITVTPPASPKDVNVPTITLMLSTPAQQKLDALLEQEADFSNTSDSSEYVSSNMQQEERGMLTYPSQAHIHPSSTPAYLPTYDHAKLDMRHLYHSPMIT